MANGFFDQVLKQAKAHQLLPADHFTVDGTMIEVWAGRISFQRTDGTGRPPEEGSKPGRSPTVD